MHFAVFWCRCKILAFAFLFSFFFSLAGHLVGFILVWKVFRKAFRILGLDERKGGWVVEQGFHGNFQVNGTWFFCLSLRCPWLNCAHSCMVWKTSHSAQVSRQSCPWPLKMMTSQAVEGTWIRTGGYRRLRDEWVNRAFLRADQWPNSDDINVCF